MLKNLLAKLVITLTIALGSTLSFAAQEVSLMYSIDYEFKPNEPQDIVNNYFFTIKAKCHIESIDQSDDVFAKIITGSGTLNSNNLQKDEEIVITVHNNDTIHIIAPSGSKVRLTNLGAHMVKAICSPA